MGIVHDQFLYFDWAKGMAGSGEIDWGSGIQRFEDFTGEIAESWETPEIGTWILKIRRGVHFALNPASEASRLVNGREFTADDAVWNIRRYHTDPAYPNASTRISYPALAKAVTVEKTGPWEITVKTPVEPWTAFFWTIWGGCAQMMFAPEVLEKYGNGPNGITDWRHMVGTGPYMLTDYVSGSVATLKKHPNWYKKDPVGSGKGNQVPYIDTIKISVVPDLSTRLAVMRTGQGDWVSNIESEDARSLIKTTPRLKYKRFLPAGGTVPMRVDRQDLPFKDKRVRQALMMATDFEAMKNDLYAGDAVIDNWPAPVAYTWLHVSMKDMPESVQALYKYNPEKAKQLLAEAGYPKGFKTKIVVESISARMDVAAVLKAMWGKVGVDLEIQPKESSVFNSILSGTQEEMILRYSASPPLLTSVIDMTPGRGTLWRISDPVVLAAYDEMQKYVFLNMPKVDEIFRKTVPYIVEQAWWIASPTPYSYTIWQPWVKNHYGELGTFNFFPLWFPYAWIDQDLKEQMTGRR